MGKEGWREGGNDRYREGRMEAGKEGGRQANASQHVAARNSVAFIVYITCILTSKVAMSG